jgi:DNA-binding transcriptional regulator GbsR (MarR family)
MSIPALDLGSTMIKKVSPQQVDHLADLIGEFIQYWGFKKIHGRIWFMIFSSTRPLDAQDLMKRLKISKALVSISIRDLLQHDVILEAGYSSIGTRTYSANPDIHGVIEQVLKNREKIMIGKIKIAFQDLKKLKPRELEDAELHEASIKEMDKLIHRGEKMLNTLMAFI